MKIPDSELRGFANNPENRIELGQCDSNAYKVYVRFQAEIYVGYVVCLKDGKLSQPTPHYWNVKRYMSDSGVEVEQLIDIYNYKEDKVLVYVEHNGGPESIEFFEKHIKKDNEHYA